MSFKVSVCKGYIGDDHGDNEGRFRVLTCYTPTPDSFCATPVSLVTDPGYAKCLVNNQNHVLAFIPSGAIIDMIEYGGINSFTARGGFTIGLGELNHAITIPLIENGTGLIANDDGGGCREFCTVSENGETAKVNVLNNSCVNFSCDGGVQSGSMRVDIYYHVKQ